MIDEQQLARVLGKIDRSGGAEVCWPYTGSTTRGYGNYFQREDGRLRKRNVTHLVLTLDGRPQPDPRSFALHSCDNPACCNPAHLRWGTARDNAEDASSRGRMPGNRRHGVGAEAARAIRAQYAAGGITLKELAVDVGLSTSAVRNIVVGASYAHAGPGIVCARGAAARKRPGAIGDSS